MEIPLPWLSMLAISIGLISHSYCFPSLDPYVGYIAQHLGVTDKDETVQFLPKFSVEDTFCRFHLESVKKVEVTFMRRYSCSAGKAHLHLVQERDEVSRALMT